MARGGRSPVLETVRRCSSTPDLAVDFFSKAFAPKPEDRLRGPLHHPYLAGTTAAMTSQLGRESEFLLGLAHLLLCSAHSTCSLRENSAVQAQQMLFGLSC